MFVILAIALTVYGCRKAHNGVELPAVMSAIGVAACLGVMIANNRAYGLQDHLVIAALLGTFVVAWWTRKRPTNHSAR